MAQLKGYSSYFEPYHRKINQLTLPFEMIWYIILKEGIYTLMFIVLSLAVLRIRPSFLFPEYLLNKEKKRKREQNVRISSMIAYLSAKARQ